MSTFTSLPGRLGTPGMALADDPCADPRMLAAMAPLGMAAAPARPRSTQARHSMRCSYLRA